MVKKEMVHYGMSTLKKKKKKKKKPDFVDEPESDSQEIFLQCQINKNILFLK